MISLDFGEGMSALSKENQNYLDVEAGEIERKRLSRARSTSCLSFEF